MSSFDDWLSAELTRLSLDEDVYGEYVKGIIADEDVELDERVENVMQILSCATEDDLTLFSTELKQQWQKTQDIETTDDNESTPTAQSSISLMLQEERRKAEQAVEEKARKEKEKLNRSKDELQMRERMLNEYGFSELSMTDENGNMIYLADEQPDSAAVEGVAENSNKSRVQAAQSAQRSKSKAEHEKKVLREKELLLRDKERKESRKKKTVKREKQRGCG